MITVTVFIPYPELHDQVKMSLAEIAMPGIEYKITYAFGTRVEEMDVGDADIILARGVTYLALKNEYPNLTVLDFTVSAYDLILAVCECKKKYAANRIAIVAPYPVLEDVDPATLMEITGAELKIFMIRNEEQIRTALENARRDGFDCVVGGLTTCNLADKRHWKTGTVRTGSETLRITLNEAMGTAVVMQNERAKAEISQTILQNSKEAILYFDQFGSLALHNRKTYETLNIPPDRAIAGLKAEELFADREICDLVRSRREAHGIVKSVNQAMLMSDYVPVRIESEAIGVICTFQRVNDIQAAENKIRKELSKKGLVAKYGFADIIHSSPALRQTISTAHKYGGVEANVLLIGETGTGKELFAQSIHNVSQRRMRPFVAVNCGAFPENLLESELFGYVDGAFSGAARGGRTGLFELAHGGTLFLDEIGEIPLNLQASLLRVLQEGEIRRIGDDKMIPVDVRIIAATNKDLREKVAAEQFRMDLLYRLDVLTLFIPPLRERREDIGVIAGHYIQRYCSQYNKPELILSPEALEALTAHDWPGNTRELRNVCERLVILSDDRTEVTREQMTGLLSIATVLPKTILPPEVPVFNGDPGDIKELLRLADSMRIGKSELADMLGINRTTLWRRIGKASK